jgi:hypothetical protein
MKKEITDLKELLSVIDEQRPVYIYRNLHKNCLSVQQDGLVKCYVFRILLEDAEFRVSEAGRTKVRETKNKNVHAKVKGLVSNITEEEFPLSWIRCFYDPYVTDAFTEMQSGRHVASADLVSIDYKGRIYATGLRYIEN